MDLRFNPIKNNGVPRGHVPVFPLSYLLHGELNHREVAKGLQELSRFWQRLGLRLYGVGRWAFGKGPASIDR
jgi:hypothetical protein